MPPTDVQYTAVSVLTHTLNNIPSVWLYVINMHTHVQVYMDVRVQLCVSPYLVIYALIITSHLIHTACGLYTQLQLDWNVENQVLQWSQTNTGR